MRKEGSLAALPVGAGGRVERVEGSPSMRRRLMDLGLVPGTRVTCVAVSPAGDPAAYRIRGAVIALRGPDAAGVRLERGEGCPDRLGPAVLIGWD
ncbi:MAG: ferrous iron transport protein A [Clostridiales bacterium]|nr:ferrous iron transport protein A [Clostridiales bacterium]MDY4181240.1 FeoA family protein [Pseudoflavonifractor sp.]